MSPMRMTAMLGALVGVSAHMTTVCTSTAASQCSQSKLTFWFGTYHSQPAPGSSVPGTIYIQNPNGVTTSFSFSSFIGSSSRSNSVCPAQDIPNNAPSSVLPTDSVVTCYKLPPGTNSASGVKLGAASDSTGSCLSFPQQSGSGFGSSTTNYYASVSNAPTGTYTVWTEGTDANLDPCGSSFPEYPCQMSSTTKFTMDLSVASCGASGVVTTCGAPPPVSNVVSASLDACAGQFAGYICSPTCNNGYEANGYVLACQESGDWSPGFGCVAQGEGVSSGASFGVVSTGAASQGDPHLALPHGGKADFRGKHGEIFNFLSAKNVSLNVKTTEANFMLPVTKWTGNMRNNSDILVHGTFLTEAHLVARTAEGRYFNVSLNASKELPFGKNWLGWDGVTASCSLRETRTPLWSKLVQPHNNIFCDEVTVETRYTSMTMLTKEFNLTVIKMPVYNRISGPTHRLDLQLSLRVAENDLAAKPHGIIGQGWDETGKARQGKLDVYPTTGEVTTYALAEGAIDGAADDYKMASPFATDFVFSAFNAPTRAPRHASPLAAAFRAAVGAVAGSSERKVAL